LALSSSYALRFLGFVVNPEPELNNWLGHAQDDHECFLGICLSAIILCSQHKHIFGPCTNDHEMPAQP